MSANVLPAWMQALATKLSTWLETMTASEWAAWVQAVGSVAAIFVAIRVARRQAAQSRGLALDLDHAAIDRQTRPIAFMVRGARSLLQELENALLVFGQCNRNQASLQAGQLSRIPDKAGQLREHLLKVPMHTLPHEQLIEAINIAIELLINVQNEARGAVNSNDPTYYTRDQVATVIDRHRPDAYDAGQALAAGLAGARTVGNNVPLAPRF